MTAPAWTIRSARADEADAVADLHAASWRIAYRGIMPDEAFGDELVPRRRAHWREVFAREGWSVILVAAERRDPVAEEADALVGFIAAWDDPDAQYDAFIQSLHVHPERKRGGIGRALIGAAAARIAAAGRRSVTLWVYDANETAKAFYCALGGTVAEESVHEIMGRPVPELRMAWPDAAALAARCGGP